MKQAHFFGLKSILGTYKLPPFNRKAAPVYIMYCRAYDQIQAAESELEAAWKKLSFKELKRIRGGEAWFFVFNPFFLFAWGLLWVFIGLPDIIYQKVNLRNVKRRFKWL